MSSYPSNENSIQVREHAASDEYNEGEPPLSEEGSPDRDDAFDYGTSAESQTRELEGMGFFAPKRIQPYQLKTRQWEAVLGELYMKESTEHHATRFPYYSGCLVYKHRDIRKRTLYVCPFCPSHGRFFYAYTCRSDKVAEHECTSHKREVLAHLNRLGVNLSNLPDSLPARFKRLLQAQHRKRRGDSPLSDDDSGAFAHAQQPRHHQSQQRMVALPPSFAYHGGAMGGAAQPGAGHTLTLAMPGGMQLTSGGLGRVTNADMSGMNGGSVGLPYGLATTVMVRVPSMADGAVGGGGGGGDRGGPRLVGGQRGLVGAVGPSHVHSPMDGTSGGPVGMVMVGGRGPPGGVAYSQPHLAQGSGGAASEHDGGGGGGVHAQSGSAAEGVAGRPGLSPRQDASGYDAAGTPSFDAAAQGTAASSGGGGGSVAVGVATAGSGGDESPGTTIARLKAQLAALADESSARHNALASQVQALANAEHMAVLRADTAAAQLEAVQARYTSMIAGLEAQVAQLLQMQQLSMQQQHMQQQQMAAQQVHISAQQQTVAHSMQLTAAATATASGQPSGSPVLSGQPSQQQAQNQQQHQQQQGGQAASGCASAGVPPPASSGGGAHGLQVGMSVNAGSLGGGPSDEAGGGIGPVAIKTSPVLGNGLPNQQLQLQHQHQWQQQMQQHQQQVAMLASAEAAAASQLSGASQMHTLHGGQAQGQTRVLMLAPGSCGPGGLAMSQGSVGGGPSGSSGMMAAPQGGMPRLVVDAAGNAVMLLQAAPAVQGQTVVGGEGPTGQPGALGAGTLAAAGGEALRQSSLHESHSTKEAAMALSMLGDIDAGRR